MDLRRTIARKLAAKNGFIANPLHNILVTPGSDSGLPFAMMPFPEDGDEVLIPDHSYHSNSGNCRTWARSRVSTYDRPNHCP